MLNRRKQLQDFNDQDDNDERTLLIGNAFHNSDNSSVINSQFPITGFKGPPIQNPYSGESYELLSSGTSGSRTIDIGDTLQNLSVKYSCPVASIKRLNNLWSDQEFYGLNKLKLPAGKLRLLADVINEERTRVSSIQPHEIPTHSISSSSLGILNQFPTPTTESIHTNQYNYVNNDDCISASSNFEEKFTNTNVSDSIFKNLDLNIARARSAARSYDDNASAIFQSLAESGNIVVEEDDDPNMIARREAETLLNDMSDYGLSYSGLILFIFIVCLICPLAYVIYLEETHHDSNKTP